MGEAKRKKEALLKKFSNGVERPVISEKVRECTKCSGRGYNGVITIKNSKFLNTCSKCFGTGKTTVKCAM